MRPKHCLISQLTHMETLLVSFSEGGGMKGVSLLSCLPHGAHSSPVSVPSLTLDWSSQRTA